MPSPTQKRKNRNEKFYLIYGDGQTVAFVVTEILHCQVLEPTSSSSKFVDLENSSVLTASEICSQVGL